MISTVTRQNDFVNGTPADAEAVDQDFDALYTKVNEIIYAILSSDEGQSLVDQMNVPEIEGVGTGSLLAILRGFKTLMDSIVLGGLPDNSVTLSKLVTALQKNLEVMNKCLANELAHLDQISQETPQSLPLSNKIYDLFDGTNNYSSGIIDTTKTWTTADIISGATSITVDDTTGFTAKKEYTIQQSDKKESFILTSITDNVLTVPALTNSFGKGAVVYRSNALLDQGKLRAGTVRSSVFPIKLSDPSSLPPGTCNGVAFSADGTYMAIVSSTAPYLAIYKRSGDTFIKLSNPTIMPGAACYCVAFSPDGKYLSVGHGNTYRQTHYMCSGDDFTAVTVPTSYPASGYVYDMEYSPDGTYLAMACSYTPFVYIYKITDGVFNKLANPATLPPGQCNSISWSPDGVYLALACNVTPFMAIYKRSEDTFNKLTNPATIPTGAGKGCAWSKNGTYLVIAHTTTPFVSAYKRTGDIFAKLSSPTDLPAGNGTGVSFSKDGAHMAVSCAITPFASLYEVDYLTDTFTKIVDPVTAPAGSCNGVVFGFNDLYLVFVHATSPYLTIYKTGTQVTAVDARYDVTPITATDEVDLWLYHERETDFSVAAYLSIVAAATNESFSEMTKTTTNIDADLAEGRYIGTVATADSNVSLKLTISRLATSTKVLTKLLGNVV